MKELRNKAGDLAMVINNRSVYYGICVQCIEYQPDDWWKVYTRDARILHFADRELLPLGGEHILQNEPQPELTQGSEAELGTEKVILSKPMSDKEFANFMKF